MAFSAITTRGSATEKTSDTTIAVSPSANLTVGKVVIVQCATDNDSTAVADGASTRHSLADSKGNTWTKIAEYTDSDGAAADGVTISLWRTVVTTAILTSDTITLTCSSTVTNKIISLFEATVGTASTIAVAQVGLGQSAIAASVSSLTSREYLLVGFGGSEGNDSSKTADADYNERFDLRTGSGTAATEICTHVQTRIATLTSDTCTSTGWTNTNPVTVLAAIYEVPNTSPTVALNSPADASSGSDTTPTLEFTGTDGEGDDVRYNVHIDTVNTFDSTSSGSVENLDQSQTSTGANFGFGEAAGMKYRGQVFTCGITGDLTKIGFSRNKGSYGIKVYIDTVDGSNLPAHAVGSELYSFTITNANVIDEYGEYTLPTPLAVTSGTKYCFYLAPWDTGSDTYHDDYQDVRGISATTGGVTEISNNGSWFTENLCFYYKTYVTTEAFGPLLNKLSGTDSGFVNPDVGGDTDPFTSGDNIQFTVQAGDALAADTYYWRVRGIDPNGLNVYGSWSSTRSFTITSGTPTNDTRPAVITGKDTSSDTRPAVVTGKDTATDNRPAVITGVDAGTAQEDRPAVTTGQDAATDNRPAVITGKDTVNDNRPAVTTGADSTADTRPAVITGKDTSSDTRDAVLTGKDSATDNRPAVTTGTDSTNDNRPMVVTGKDTATDNRPAVVTGTDSSNDNRPAVVTGTDSANDTRPVVVTGKDTLNEDRPAVLTGTDSANDNRPAVITGKDTADSDTQAVLTGKDTAVDSRFSVITGQDSIISEIMADLWGMDTAFSDIGLVLTGFDIAFSERGAVITGKIYRSRPTVLGDGVGITVLESRQTTTSIPSRGATIIESRQTKTVVASKTATTL